MDVMFKEMGYIMIKILGNLNILFLDSRRYFSASLDNIASRYGLPIQKTIFPYGALESKCYDLTDVTHSSIHDLFTNSFESAKQKRR